MPSTRQITGCWFPPTCSRTFATTSAASSSTSIRGRKAAPPLWANPPEAGYVAAARISRTCPSPSATGLAFMLLACMAISTASPISRSLMP